jgi:uncharacterized membrane protein YkoI
MRLYATAIAVCLLQTALAAKDLHEIARTMVPKGRIVEQVRRDYIVKTPAGSKISIEFDRSKNFKEAAGKNLNHGDELEPGKGLISLSTAAAKAQALGNKIGGSWLLEMDREYGWVYEIESEKQGKTLDLLINASTGELIKAEERSLLALEDY